MVCWFAGITIMRVQPMNKIKYTLLILILMFFSGCTKSYWQYTDQDGVVYKNTKYDSVLEFIEELSSHTVVNGVVLLVDSEGSIYQETPVVSNVVQGIVKFYRNDKLFILASYTNGVNHGIHKTWHENGVLASISCYSNDVLCWDRESWYDNGQRKTENYWIDKKLKILRERDWDRSGNLISDGVSSNLNSINGSFIVLHVKGQPPEVGVFTNGVFVRGYYYNGNADNE